MPVFLFALAISENVNIQYTVLVFIALHIFLYPASNGYNSYFDKDEGSIGGIKNPPKVSIGLYYMALIFDLIALIIGSFNLAFVGMLFVYGIVSKAYSHPSIRIKKYPLLSWFIAGFFQGFFTFGMAYLGINNLEFNQLFEWHILIPASLTSFMLWGSYPMTQIYQHKEDSSRGDITLSIKLGVLNTFHFTMLLFAVASGCFVFYFISFYQLKIALIYLVAMAPVVLYFFYWYLQVRKEAKLADYEHTMKLNTISALCLNAFFLFLFFQH